MSDAPLPVTKTANSGFSRRQWVRRMLAGTTATAATLAAGPAIWGEAGGHPMSAHLGNDALMDHAEAAAAAPAWAPLFLDAHQSSTLEALAERMVPGSTAAQVNRFIDLLLSVDELKNQRSFVDSLSTFEGLSLRHYGKPFVRASATEQDSLLASAASPTAADLFPHFQNLKTWIAGAYYTSEVGMKELGWTGDVFFNGLPGCQAPQTAKTAIGH